MTIRKRDGSKNLKARKKKKTSNKLAGKKRLKEQWMEVALAKLMEIRAEQGRLGGKEKDLADLIRKYAEKNATGRTAKGYKFWQGKKLGAELRDNIAYKGDTLGLLLALIWTLNFKKAAEFFKPDRDAIITAAKKGKIPIPLKEVEKYFTKEIVGKKKVIPYSIA